jgi:hypothetical protein
MYGPGGLGVIEGLCRESDYKITLAWRFVTGIFGRTGT